MKKQITFLAAAVLTAMLGGCSEFLEPLPNGSYNSENYSKYPAIFRGYIDKAYNLLPYTYYSVEYAQSDAITDDACWRDPSEQMRQLGIGTASPANYPFADIWTRNYTGIYYTNLFLKDDIGRNTRYLLDSTSDELLRQYLQGDAFALRAYYQYNLLKTFAGKNTDGQLLGFPIVTDAIEVGDMDNSKLKRNTFDECVEQILKDCDSAMLYLPLANRDFVYSEGVIAGAARYKAFDQIAISGLKAMTYLLWASPAFNPSNDVTRYEKAAENAYAVLNHKLTVEGISTVSKGFNPASAFQWTDTDSPEVVWLSRASTGSTIETNFYPQGFNGKASIAPSQDLVDAFPMANGYPITDTRSGYNPAKPYVGRDPRFYASIFYNGSTVKRSDNQKITYTFDTTSDGKDAAGGVNTSPTNYYIKKFVHLNWNKGDETVENGTRAIFFMRWSQMCLIFAEAANAAYGPNDASLGMSAKEAIAYLRKRPTSDGTNGLGTMADPYLNECASDRDSFAELVKNEWRVETCFEGQRFFNLRRWSTSATAVNVPVHMVDIARADDGKLTYDYSKVVETRSFPSLWLPIPYTEIRKAPNIEQNAGWDTWK